MENQNLFEKLGVTPVINATGTMTSLGGCRTRPEVMAAMEAVAGEFVPLEELHHQAGAYLAQVLGVEAALVIAGAAAGLTLATASCMVRDQPDALAKLPQPPQKHKVIIQCCHRNPFERAISMAGATLIQVGDAIRTQPVDLETALDAETAAVVHFLQADMLDASLKLPETLEIAHRYGVPVIVDAAAELPPKSNLWTFAQHGADLVLFSGSKDLRGPQTSGLMVGREDLINLAVLQSAPHEHVIGRPLKAGKEIVAGMVAAVEAYLAEDETARFAEWDQIAAYLLDEMGSIPGLRVTPFTPTQPFIQPAITPRVAVDLVDGHPFTIPGLQRALWEGNSPIATEIIRGRLILNTHILTLAEAETIAKKTWKVLKTFQV